MNYDGEFLKEVHHNDIKDDMAAIGFKPHHSPQHLISRFTYGCEFYTLRYWRSKDTEWMTDHFYDSRR